MENFKSDLKIIITGGAGFIGSNLIRSILNKSNCRIYNIDKLSYASDHFWEIYNHKNYQFINLDLCNFNVLKSHIMEISPDLIFNLAAESHVDRSIDSPSNFINSNIQGTFNLLEATRLYLSKKNLKHN